MSEGALALTSVEREAAPPDVDPNCFAGTATGYVLFRLFGLPESLVVGVLEHMPPHTQKALQASCRSLRRFMNSRVKRLRLVGDDGTENMLDELLERFPAAEELQLEHISWASINNLTRQSRGLLRSLRVIEIKGWKQRENLIEVEHAISSLLSCTSSLASLHISLVKVGPHCLPKAVLASMTRLTELRLDSQPLDCQFAFNAICLLTSLQRAELAMTVPSCSLKSITSLAQLRHLHLECQAISATDMDRIAHLPRLTALSLEAKLPDAIPPATWAPHHAAALHHLTLRHGAIHNCEVLGLSRLTSLSKLALDAVEFSSLELSHLTQLTKLKVSGPQHQPYALNGILLAACPAALLSLSLHHAGTIAADDALAFAPFAALTRLSLRATLASGADPARVLTHVTALSALQVLEYDGDVTADIVELLGHLPALREVHTTGAFSISCELDVCLPALTQLQAHDLRDAGVGLRALGFLAPQLRHLDVQESSSDSVDTHCLMAIGCGCHHLTRLKVLFTAADDAALLAIGRGCPLLAHLALYAPAATSKALTTLAEGCRRLTHLKLMDVGNITDVGLIALARSCGRLQKLYLVDAAQVTDAGVVALMVLRELEKFFIKGAKGVTQVGMAALAACPQLKAVKVIYCAINREETRDLFHRLGVAVQV